MMWQVCHAMAAAAAAAAALAAGAPLPRVAGAAPDLGRMRAHAEAQLRELQAVDETCLDLYPLCSYFARPHVVREANAGWKRGANVFSDRGYCNVGDPELVEFWRGSCPRSCGLCQASCSNMHDERGHGFTCDEILELEPDACRCNEGLPAEGNNHDACINAAHGAFGLTYMQNFCTKTCFENGDLPYASPCNDVCKSGEHPCKLPFSIGSDAQEYTQCIPYSVAKPKNWKQHQMDTFEQRWCPFNSVYADNMEYGYCSCTFDEAVPTDVPSTGPTVVPSPSPSVAATKAPTSSPLQQPSASPTLATANPTITNTSVPTKSQTRSPSESPSESPTRTPTARPSAKPSKRPTFNEHTCNSPSGEKLVKQLEDCIESGTDCDLRSAQVDPSYDRIFLCSDHIVEIPSRASLNITNGGATEPRIIIECSPHIRAIPIFMLREEAELNLEGVEVRGCLSYVFNIAKNARTAVAHSVFAGNGDRSLSYDGGVVFGSGRGASFVAHDSEFVGNSAREGGVFANDKRIGYLAVELHDCVIADNVAHDYGGVFAFKAAILSSPGSVVVSNTEFRNNHAMQFGGILSVTGESIGVDAHFINSTFTNNSAVQSGGVIFFDGMVLLQAINNDPLNPFKEDGWLSDLTFSECNFDSNSASLEGGVVFMQDNGFNRLAFRQSAASGSSASQGGIVSVKTQFYPPNDVYFSKVTGPALLMESSHVSNCQAAKRGGAIAIVGRSWAKFNQTQFASNSAETGGAVACQDEGCRIEFVGCSLAANSALGDGGALMVDSEASINVQSTEFIGNRAGLSGGGIFAHGAGPLKSDATGNPPLARGLQAAGGEPNIEADAVRFLNNSANHGGCMFTKGTLAVITSARLEGNSAIEGGCLYLDTGSQLNASTVSLTANLAFGDLGGRGGAILAAFGSTAALGQCQLSNNRAQSLGGAMAISHGADVSCVECLFATNSIQESQSSIGGGAIGVMQQGVEDLPLNVRFSRVNFTGNAALTGKDIFFAEAKGYAMVPGPDDILEVEQRGDSVNGSLTCHDCSFGDEGGAIEGSAVLSSLPMAFKAFVAQGEAGADCEELGPEVTQSAPLVATSGDVLHPLCVVAMNAFGMPTNVPKSHMVSLTVTTGNVSSNKIELVAQMTRIAISDRVALAGIQVFAREGQYRLSVSPHPDYHPPGDYYSPSMGFELLLPLNLVPCRDGKVLQTHPSSSIPACMPSSQLAPPGFYVVDPFADPPVVAKCPSGTFRTGDMPAGECGQCQPGHVTTSTRTQCKYCDTVVTLSWDPKRETCDACPAGANCFGGADVVPRSAFYHSSMRSYQFHNCLAPEACQYNGRSDTLERIRNESGLHDLILQGANPGASSQRQLTDQRGKTVVIRNETGEQLYLQAQCAEAYTGPLCGSCAEGFQRSSLTKCQRCRSYTSNVVYFVLTFLILLMFLVFTVNRTFRLRDETPNATKVFVAFLQQVSLLGAFRGGWPDEVDAFISFVAGSTSGELNSIGCLFRKSSIPTFVIRAFTTIYVVPAVLMILIPAINWILRRTTKFGRSFAVKVKRDNVVIMVIIVYFFLYPFIVTETVKLFACVTVDETNDQSDPYTAALFQPGSFLLTDTMYECFVSPAHRRAALGLGVPSLVVFVIGLPATLVIFLARNQARFSDPDFSARFGFIYVGIHHRRWWWFFVAMLRTSLLAVIGMLVAEPGYQNLVAQCWLVAYLTVVIFAQPYHLRTILHMEVVSVSCILALLYINMWMLMVRAAEPLHFEDYNSSFAALILVLVIGSFLVLVVLGAFAVVAINEKVNPSDLTFRDVWIYFRSLTASGLTFLDKKLGSNKSNHPDKPTREQNGSSSINIEQPAKSKSAHLDDDHVVLHDAGTPTEATPTAEQLEHGKSSHNEPFTMPATPPTVTGVTTRSRSPGRATTTATSLVLE